MRRARETGSLKPERICGYRRPVLEPHKALLRELSDGKDITLADIQAELSRRVGITPDLSTIHRCLRPLGLRLKRVAESRRVGSARCPPQASALAGVAAVHRCEPLCRTELDRHGYHYDPTLWPLEVKVVKFLAKEERPLKRSALGAGSEGAERVRGRTSIQSRIDPALP
jgi:hypothetical protein